MTETRRHALKLLGAIGATCAFPFAGDELYGQHVHTSLAQAPSAAPYAPAFFTPAEYATLSRLTDVIIPATDDARRGRRRRARVHRSRGDAERRTSTVDARGTGVARGTGEDPFLTRFSVAGGIRAHRHPAAGQRQMDRQRREALEARFRREPQGKTVYYAAVTDRDYPARPSSLTSARVGRGPSRPVLPPHQEPDRRRVLHVPHRPPRGTRLRGQQGAGTVPVVLCT